MKLLSYLFSLIFVCLASTSHAKSLPANEVRASAISAAKKFNAGILARTSLPQEIKVTEKVEEVVFADDKRISIVRIRVTFVVDGQPIDEVMASFILIRNATDEWDFGNFVARPTEKTSKQNTREESNGTKL